MSFSEIARLTFEEPDLETFPLLKLAYDALKADDGSTIVLNAANEIAVEAFLEGRIGFTDIYETVIRIMNIFKMPLPYTVEEIFNYNKEARISTKALVSQMTNRVS